MKKILTLVTLMASAFSQADTLLEPIQNQWAICQYQVPVQQKESCLEKLSSEAEQISTANSQRTDLLIWSAIVKSSWAGAKGGLGALSLVKSAKQQLEQAIKQNPAALDGSAYTSLGSLYYQVPGWPIGFGNKEQAEQLLKQALNLNPNGIDPNYFYGDFLLEQGRKAEARQYLNKALVAPPRPGRELADKGRRKEIETKLAAL